MELTDTVRIVPGRSYGFFTDTTVCIGCKACEVACKEWNNLPADHVGLSGESYDNTGALSANTWRHVAFIEKPAEIRATERPTGQGGWLMLSDVCKHCHNAPCMEACPTGALFKTEFDTVVVQQDICNGCGYCVPACPFGVVDLNQLDGKAHKCTLCYDRLKGGLEPACAKSCPTDSIQFGELNDLHVRARRRVDELKAQGVASAYLYGVADGPGATGDLGNLSAFFLLTDTPETYNLPRAPTRPSRRVAPALVSGLATVAGLALTAAVAFGRRGVEAVRGEDYYGRPGLKPAPFNNWVVGGYVFLAGLGGKLSLLTGLADLIRPARSEAMIRGSRYLPLLVPSLGAGLLIYDLHTPQRFYNMFRVAKGTSPMSIGTWVLSGYSLSSIASAVLHWAGFRRAAAAANAPAAVLGAGMGTYTAALLAATSTPLWAAAPRTLAARFASASFASAAATLSLMEDEGPTKRALDTVLAVALASELALEHAQTVALRRAGIQNALGGGWGLVHKLGATGAGAAVPLGLLVLSALGERRSNMSRVASGLALAGAFMLRVSTLEAGSRSATDPAIGFRFAQPDNLPRVRPPRRRVRRPVQPLARSPQPPSG